MISMIHILQIDQQQHQMKRKEGDLVFLDHYYKLTNQDQSNFQLELEWNNYIVHV